MGREGITIPSCAAAGIGLTTRRQDQPGGTDDAVRRGHDQARRLPLHGEDWLAQGQDGAAALQTTQQNVQHVGGSTAAREDLAIFLHGGWYALGFE